MGTGWSTLNRQCYCTLRLDKLDLNDFLFQLCMYVNENTRKVQVKRINQEMNKKECTYSTMYILETTTKHTLTDDSICNYMQSHTYIIYPGKI